MATAREREAVAKKKAAEEEAAAEEAAKATVEESSQEGSYDEPGEGWLANMREQETKELEASLLHPEIPPAYATAIRRELKGRGQTDARAVAAAPVRAKIVGDVMVRCLKDNNTVHMGDRRYVLKAGTDIAMHPSHADHLQTTGWVAVKG